MAESKAFIGFPERMLRDEPVRLPLIRNGPDWYVLNKIAGLSAQVHPWYSSQPDITSAIRKQIQAGKGELKRQNIENAFYICGPEPEVSGPVLYAKNKQTADSLKNSLGSDLFKFTYLLIASGNVSDSELVCSLPVAYHSTESRALISHQSGKKSLTTFKKIRETMDYSFWEAESTHPRMHQIRLHAAEAGLIVLGDSLYGGQSSAPSKTGQRLARFPGIALAMIGMDFTPVRNEDSSLKVELPKPYSAFLKKTGLATA